jgi:ankyrin repeat protein
LTCFRFLLAKLHLDSLIGKTSKKAIQNALKKLETGYEAYDSAYTSAMERIGSQVTDQAELAKQVIAWIIHAKRPFTAQELQVALSIEIGEREHDEYNCPDVDDMVSVCAGLVTVDQGSGIIRLVHYTTQEYFDRTRHTWFPDAEVLITTACLSYLSYDNIPPLTTYDVCERWDRQKNSFYIYAVIFWGEHAQSAPSALPHIMDFLRQPKHVRAVGKILFGFCRYTCPSGPRETCTSLHLSAFFGLEAAVSATLKDFVNHDSEKSGDATPLMVAACRGHKTVVKLLLDCTTAKDYANHSTDDGSALHYAVRCGHQTIVELLLKYNARVSARDGSGNTPLYYACSSGSEDSVKLLLDAGAKVNNCKNNCGDTPLHAACEKDNENIVGLLLSAGAKVNNWKNDRGGTPFHAACKNSNEAIVRLLLGVGAEINERNDTYGMTPLYLACNKESEATIKLLLGAGAKVNDRNHGSGGTPLHAAVYRGGEAAIELLLGVGADVNARNNSGSTPLHSNSSRVTEATINSFLAAGADINARNDRGFTPLHIIVCRGSEAAVKLFLAAGADINARNNDGRTPLYVACRSRSTETTIKLLLESGANVNARDNGGSTPLHATIYRGKEAAIKLILGAGADVNARDNGGSTPLYIACRKGEEAVIKLLLGKGANSNARNNEGCTPLHVTISRGMKAAIKLLLDSGANVNAVCCPEGWFPLNIARDECIAEILREYGAQKAPASLQILEAISVSKVERTKMVHVRHSRRSQRFLAITNARVGIQHGIGET